MSFKNVSRHLVNKNPALGSSYAEISRFVRPRHYGIALNRINTCSGKGVRSFSTSKCAYYWTEEYEKLTETLNDYKASFVRERWSLLEKAWTFTKISKFRHGETIQLVGYLETGRDVNKHLTFSLLRSPTQTRKIQLVSSSNSDGPEATAHALVRSLKPWTPVLVRGEVFRREMPSGKQVDPQLISEREIRLEHIQPLNMLPKDLIITNDTVFGPEQRHLQLRTNSKLRENLILRDKATGKASHFLKNHDWTEIETPVLFKSTPEGAREFLVPTRQKGRAYALPQSPQQYKQILMASGFNKYFQFARCFRDEDLRADRQPEFTQLDMEMSFADEDSVMAVVENMVKYLWKKVLIQSPQGTFVRMTYQKAMSKYGSDKPDMRFESLIQPLTEYLPVDLVGKITSLPNPMVEGIQIPISDDPATTRKFISGFLDSPEGKPYLENSDGQPAVFVGDLSRPMNGLGPLGHDFYMNQPKSFKIANGDLLILQARPDAPFSGGSTVLGNLRTALFKAAIAQGLVKQPGNRQFKFVWITDFPLFTSDSDGDPGQGGTAGFSSTHHPFTAPKTQEDVDLLLTDPASAKAAHYDLVVNGIELGGGSRRIHHAAMQELVFRDILKMRPDRIEDFRHLLNVLGSGCPPHAGFALGWDRLMAVMCGTDSIRDVIAFPKSGKGEDVLVKSPNGVTEEQLSAYNLQWKGKRDEDGWGS